MAALAAYNEHPYDIKDKQITFAEVYLKWAAIKYKDGEVPNTYKAAYARLPGLYDLPFVDIRKRHIQGEIDACPLGYSTKKMMKTLCNQLYKYAIDAELVTTNFAHTVELPPQTASRIHAPFNPEELAALWHAADNDAGARFALILSYTGLRPTELLKIKTENVHPEERYMMGGMKTAAGKNRVIPIAEKIYPFIQALYNQDNEYLVMDPKDGKPMLTYDRLREHVWEKSQALRALNKKHLPHDGRHTCATLLDDAGVNLKTTQLILGHRSANITHRVYTHKTIQQLIDAINLI
jgi:integrase